MNTECTFPPWGLTSTLKIHARCSAKLQVTWLSVPELFISTKLCSPHFSLQSTLSRSHALILTNIRVIRGIPKSWDIHFPKPFPLFPFLVSHCSVSLKRAYSHHFVRDSQRNLQSQHIQILFPHNCLTCIKNIFICSCDHSDSRLLINHNAAMFWGILLFFTWVTGPVLPHSPLH